MNHQRACQILGVPTDASVTTIKLSYHQLVRVWHPDRFADDQPLQERAEWQLRQINVAYDICLRGKPSPEEPSLERETPWYPPPSESVRTGFGSPTGFVHQQEEARLDGNMMGLVWLAIFFAVGAAMIMLAT